MKEKRNGESRHLEKKVWLQKGKPKRFPQGEKLPEKLPEKPPMEQRELPRIPSLLKAVLRKQQHSKRQRSKQQHSKQ